MRRASVLVLLLSAAAGTPQAHAQLYSGPYIGLGVGVASFEEDGNETGAGFSDTSSIYKLFGGYHIHEGLAVELGIAKSDGLREEFVAFNPLVGEQSLEIDAEQEVTTLRVLAVAPLGGMDFFGGIGFYDADYTLSIRYTDDFFVETDSLEKNASGATLVGGILFHLDRLIIRGEYEWFDDKEGVNTQALNLGVMLRFGR